MDATTRAPVRRRRRLLPPRRGARGRARGRLLFPPGEANPVERLTLPYLLPLAASTGLIVVGRTLLRTARDGGSQPPGARPHRRPEPTTLERLGYRSPPPETDREFVYGDGEVYAVCRECGERNGRTFDYCRGCSAELPW